MLRKIRSLLIGCAVVLTISSLNAFGQEKKVVLKDKRINIQMTQKSLYTVFNRLINKYDIAIGFEESALDRDHRDYYFETNMPLDGRHPSVERDYRDSYSKTKYHQRSVPNTGIRRFFHLHVDWVTNI